MVGGGSIVTAELADLAVDQCALVEERFTLLSADNYRGDYLEIELLGRQRRTSSRPSRCGSMTTRTRTRTKTTDGGRRRPTASRTAASPTAASDGASDRDGRN